MRLGGCQNSKLESEIGRINSVTLGGTGDSVTFYYLCENGSEYLRTFASDKYVVNTLLHSTKIENLKSLILQLEMLQSRIKAR